MPVHSVAIAQIYSVYAIQRHCGPIVSWGRFALSTEADWIFKEVGLAFNLAWARKCAVPREDHIFSKSDFKGLCAWKKIVLHIMILFICYLCFKLPFFFLQISNFVHCFSCFWYAIVRNVPSWKICDIG